MNALELAKALAAKLNADGADYEAAALPGDFAQARLTSKADKARTVDLLIREVSAGAGSGAFQTEFAAALKAKKSNGALTALAVSEPKAGDAARLAASARKLIAEFEKAKPDSAGVKSMKGLGEDTGLKVASWADESGPLTVNLLHRVATPAPAVASTAATQWLVLVQPDESRPPVRVVAVPLPEGDVIRARWWASPKGGSWAFRPF